MADGYYLLDGKRTHFGIIIDLAKQYGYKPKWGFSLLSEAAQVLKENGYTVEDEPPKDTPEVTHG